MDRLTKEHRSWNMSQIRSADTGPELAVRSALHRLGFRFRLMSGRSLPGRPDIVLPKHRTIVFVHGCFWHRHAGCRMAYTPKSRIEFWTGKFAGNVTRDKRAARRLRREGWKVVTIWECQTADVQRLQNLLRRKLVAPATTTLKNDYSFTRGTDENAN
jgi:DNA mismatch endonuclease (patch repair protein)